MEPGEFSTSSKAFTKNPLGIIALFIFLVYSIASLVLGVSADALNVEQKWAFVLFLVVFPPLVLCAFVWLVANHAVKLYSPSDFQDERSYVELNQKIELVEIKQKAAQVDPRGDIREAQKILNQLLAMGLIDAAKSVAKAFLKVGRYSESLSLFEEIGIYLRRAGKSDCKMLSYKSYCLIGLCKYSNATDLLLRVRQDSPSDFDFWPKVALSYCLEKEGKKPESDELLRLAVMDIQAKGYINEVRNRYPEISQKFIDYLSGKNDNG
ncbi:MAG: hypothetical protein EPN21_10335 [Methylococcaceae bacterium]|nr:MAG: hypothetical protein EPN21_10335 [Methylococcaceae bacterium]